MSSSVLRIYVDARSQSRFYHYNVGAAEVCNGDSMPSRFDGDSMIEFLQLSLDCDGWLVKIR